MSVCPEFGFSFSVSDVHTYRERGDRDVCPFGQRPRRCVLVTSGLRGRPRTPQGGVSSDPQILHVIFRFRKVGRVGRGF